MIAYLRGRVSFIDEEYCILDVGGVGYHVYCSQKTIQELKSLSGLSGYEQSPFTTLYTRLIHRDESMDLYGFLRREECVLFNLLNTVSGIGPKQSMRILGMTETQDIVKAVVSEDSTFLMSLGGIGNKKAQQIILELKEKMKKAFDTEESPVSSIYIEALSALQSLGFTSAESRQAVEKALNLYRDNQDVGKIVEAALKLLS